MKKLLFIIAMFTGSAAMAQPVINSNVFPSAGTTVTYTDVDSTVVTTLTEGSAGANQSWNFIAATSSGSSFATEYINAAGTPHAGSFPGSNICGRFPDGMGDYFYSYYTHSATSTEINGTGYIVSGTPVLTIYSDPQTMLSYPKNFGGSFTDNFASLSSSSIGGFTINNYSSGSNTTTVDAYGSVTTPAGTYPNCQRMKTVSVRTDSSVYVGLPLPPAMTFSSSTSYSWASAGAADKLYQFSLGYDTTVSQSGQFNTKFAQYQSGLTVTGINTFTPAMLHANAYPNPAADHIKLVLDKPVNGSAVLNIYDINGRVVKQLITEMNAGDRFAWMFPVQDLASGLYSAVVTCNDRSWQLKIVRE